MGLKQAKQEEVKDMVVKTHEKKFDGSFTTKKAEERQKEIDRLRRERIKEIDRLNKLIESNNLTRNYFKEAQEQEEIDEKGKKKAKKSTKKKPDSKNKKPSSSVKKKDDKKTTSKSPTKTAKSADKKGKKDKDGKKSKDKKTEKNDKKEGKEDKKKVSKSEDKKDKKDADKKKKDPAATTTKNTPAAKQGTQAKGGAGNPQVQFGKPEEDDPVDAVDGPELLRDAGKPIEDDDIDIAHWDPKFTKEQELYFKKFMNQKLTQKFPTPEQKVFADMSSIFTEVEKTRLKAYFDTQKNNDRVGIMAFIKLPAILNSPVNDYIVNSLDKELKGRRITFNEFLSYLSILHPLCPSEFKNTYIFSMIDRGDKGHIDKPDVMALIARISKVNMDAIDEASQTQVEKIKNFVKQVFLTYDLTGQGKLDRSMFLKALTEPEVAKIVALTSLDLSKLDAEPEVAEGEMGDNPG